MDGCESDKAQMGEFLGKQTTYIPNIYIHRVQSLPRKRGCNSDYGFFSRRIAVVFASFVAILKKIFVGELRKSFFKNKKRLCASVKTSWSGSTHISLITECLLMHKLCQFLKTFEEKKVLQVRP